MASCSAHKVTQRLVFSCGGWAKGCSLTLQPPQYQRHMVLPFFWKPSQPFSLLQRGITTSKLKTLSSFTLRSKILTDNSVRSILETVGVVSRLPSARFGCGEIGEQWRGFSVTASAANQHGMGKGDTSHELGTRKGDTVQELGHKIPTSGEDDWALRLANENGYLSWCRNCYLTTVVAIAMMAEGTTPLAVQAMEGALFVAGLNLTWGTYQYVYNLLCLRHRTGMSAVGALTYICMATLHLFLWFMVCTIFLGYTDEPENKAVGLEKPIPKQQGQDV